MKHNNLKQSKMSITYKVLLYFILFSAIIISLLWILQLFIMNYYYENLKTREIDRVALEVVDMYTYDNFDQYAITASAKNDLNIYVFSFEDNEIGKNLYISNSYGNNISKQFLIDFAQKFGVSGQISYRQSRSMDSLYYTFGKKVTIEDVDTYFYFGCVLTANESTTKVYNTMFRIISVATLILGVVLAVYMSRMITKPITQLTKSAKKFTSDNDGKFSANGYNEIVQLSEALNVATLEIQKSDKMRKDLLANVSHELRTPITIITSYAEMIRDISGDRPEKRNEHLQIIINEAERLKVLVNDVLDLSKMQSFDFKFSKEAYNLSEQVETICQVFKKLYSNKDYEFEYSIDEGIIINADKNRISQVIYNLIANAINYSNDDKRINIQLHKQGDNQARLDIIDHGVGIPEDQIDNIFDRFFRSEITRRTKVGTGIGLAIVKQVLQAHDYDFGVKSKVGEGSDFYIVLDLLKQSNVDNNDKK